MKSLRTSLSLLALAMLLAPAPSAAAPLSWSVRYGVSFAGLPVGRVHLEVTLDGDRYALKASGKVAGPASLVSNDSGTMAASGRLAARPHPEHYSATILADREEPDVVTIAFRDGNAVEVAVRPEETEPARDRVPLTGAHRAGTIDPLSAVLARFDAASGGRACPAVLPIFDGRQRFDLVLTFDRMEGGAPISEDATRCKVRYEPVAGHRAGRRTIRDLRDKSDMEIAFARLAESEIMAPVRIRVGTPLGALVFQADRFAAAIAP